MFAATFLGTAILQPGRFNPLGTLIAVYFLATGILGLHLLGATGWVTNVFYGGVLVIAVTLSTCCTAGRAAPGIRLHHLITRPLSTKSSRSTS